MEYFTFQKLPDFSEGSISFGDIDGDGDIDLFMSGGTPNTGYSSILKNDGTGLFKEVLNHGITNLSQSDSKFADLDNDNDLDLIVLGQNTNGQKQTLLYLNDGIGNFTLKLSPFIGLYRSYITVFDADGDADLDVILTGVYQTSSDIPLYINDGNANFTLNSSTGLPPVSDAQLDTIDVNNDGHLDVLLVGNEASDLYINDGTGYFRQQSKEPFIPFFNGARAAVGDIDGDNDDDVLIVGRSFDRRDQAFLYRNNTCMSLISNETVQNISVCFGDNFTYFDGSVSNYILQDESKTHVVPGGSSYGCDSLITQNLSVIKIDNTTEVSNNEIISNQENGVYEWLLCGATYSPILNEINQSFTPSINGSFAAKISLNGCVDTTSCHTIIITNMSEVDSLLNVRVYPNPTTENVTVSANFDNILSCIKLRSCTGELIIEKKYSLPMFEVQIPEVSGVYFLEVKNGQSFKTIKVIKQ